jgi:1-deoxy-D-xylulose-5-phosphate reductoisomerase
MIELIDGSIIAQMGVTDMRHAIQYALTYPARQAAELPSLDLTTSGKLEFYEPDLERFPCIELAYQALRRGGTTPAVLNAANEIAVAAFLDERIKFGQIPALIRAACEAHSSQPVAEIETVLAADAWAREWVSQKIPEAIGANKG